MPRKIITVVDDYHRLGMFISSFCSDYLKSLDSRGKELKRKLGYIMKLHAIMALQTLGIYNLVRSGNSFTIYSLNLSSILAKNLTKVIKSALSGFNYFFSSSLFNYGCHAVLNTGKLSILIG